MNSIAKGLLILSFIVSLGAVSKVHAIAGKIVYSYGQVEATSADGVIRPLVRGDVIESGESIRTINGRTQIRFTDGGFVALQPNTQYRLEDYNFEGTVDGSEKSFFNTQWGAHFLTSYEIFKKNQGSLANKIFLLKWGISIKTFKKHYLKSYYIHNEDLANPNKNLYYYLDVIKDYISRLYYKIFSSL